MKIIDVQTGDLSIPLIKPFKTALRTAYELESVVVKIITDTGHVGFGEAPPTAVITGDTKQSIKGAIEQFIKKRLIGMEIENFEEIMLRLHSAVIKNTSAKAAVDMALYDLYGQLYKAPLYQLLGGYRKEIITDVTISVNDPEEMAQDSLEAYNKGYGTLKIKVGKDASKDIERLKAIREAIGYNINLRIDANQGWKPKEAVSIIRKMEDVGLDIELIEQPVLAHDLKGMKFVRDHVLTPILADESIFSPKDAMTVIQMEAADLINIKLMKTGGIYNALKICSMAEVYGIECMIGCMLESKLSVTAATHLAGGKHIITKADLDGPALCETDPIEGGAKFNHYHIQLSDEPGLGIKGIQGVVFK